MDNKVYNNTDSSIKPKSFISVLKWKLTSKSSSWPQIVPLLSNDIPPKKIAGKKIRVSFVGHVTFFIQTCGLNILTDPVWSDRASPVAFAGPKRVTPPGIKFDDLPKIDFILISHNHYDHMDIPTIKNLWQRDKPKIITPLMNDVILRRHISDVEVITLDWHQLTNFKDTCSIALEPAQHWSARSLFDKNRALWGSFIITTNAGSICFIGDSGYNKDIFKAIGTKYRDIKLSLIPIGAFEPRWFMKDVHMNPEEAILVHQDLKSEYSIGSHFQTFKLADDKFSQAADELDQARIRYKIPPDTFITPQIGSTYLF